MRVVSNDVRKVQSRPGAKSGDWADREAYREQRCGGIAGERPKGLTFPLPLPNIKVYQYIVSPDWKIPSLANKKGILAGSRQSSQVANQFKSSEAGCEGGQFMFLSPLPGTW